MFTSPWQKPVRGIQLNKAHTLARGLVGCWVMNEATGDKIVNLVDSIQSSSMSTGIIWDPNGLYFDGTDEQIEIKTKQFENIFHRGATGHFTIVCRYAPAQVSSPAATKVYTLLGSEQVPGDRVKFYHRNNWGENELYLDVSDGWADTSITTGTITSSLTEGQFSDIVVAWDGANAHIYIDGIDKTTSGALVAANFPDGTQNYFRIGDQENTVHYLYGGLEFVYLFDRYLSPEEVAWLNRKPYAMFEQPISPGLLYYEAVGDVATDLLHGKIIIKDSSIVLVDGLLQIKDIATDLADGKVKVQDKATGLADGLLRVQDKATGLADGKVQVQDSTTNLADGKVIVTTVGADTGQADGKIQIKDVTTGIVDGLIKVKDSVTGLTDGKVKISNIGSNLADGLIRIKDTTTGIADGKVQIQDVATGTADGLLKIIEKATSNVDGKLKIKDTIKDIADGKISITGAVTAVIRRITIANKKPSHRLVAEQPKPTYRLETSSTLTTDIILSPSDTLYPLDTLYPNGQNYFTIVITEGS